MGGNAQSIAQRLAPAQYSKTRATLLMKRKTKNLPKDKGEAGHFQSAVGAHTYNLRTLKAEAGGFLKVKNSLGYRDPV